MRRQHPNPIELDFNGRQRETSSVVLIIKSDELNTFAVSSTFRWRGAACGANSDTVNDKAGSGSASGTAAVRASERAADGALLFEFESARALSLHYVE